MRPFLLVSCFAFSLTSTYKDRGAFGEFPNGLFSSLLSCDCFLKFLAILPVFNLITSAKLEMKLVFSFFNSRYCFYNFTSHHDLGQPLSPLPTTTLLPFFYSSTLFIYYLRYKTFPSLIYDIRSKMICSQQNFFLHCYFLNLHSISFG